MYSGEMWYHEMTWDQGLWRNSTLSNYWIYTPTGRAVVFRTQRLQVRILLDPPKYISWIGEISKRDGLV